MTNYLGIDIAKATFDVHLVRNERRWSAQFDNNSRGYVRLQAWLNEHNVQQVWSCMEATGTYGVALATSLFEQGHQVSVVNPKATHHYAKSKLRRNKTDKLDAQLLAEYCHKETPRLWQPAAEELQTLRALTRRLAALQSDRTREINRLKAGHHHPVVKQSIETTITFFAYQIKQLEAEVQQHIDQHPDSLAEQRRLLTSMPGIGNKTAAIILGELPDISFFKSGKQVSAFAGLTPEQLQSGNSSRTRGLAKLGSKRLRTALYLPAVVGMKYNPILAALAKRLAERGKNNMTIIGALMRKLLQLAYGVLKTQHLFDPNFVANSQLSA